MMKYKKGDEGKGHESCNIKKGNMEKRHES